MMIRTAKMMGLGLFSMLGTSMLLGCSGDVGSTESVKQLASGGGGGAKAPLSGLAAGTSGAGASAGGAAAGGAAAGSTASAGSATGGGAGASGAGAAGAGAGG